MSAPSDARRLRLLISPGRRETDSRLMPRVLPPLQDGVEKLTSCLRHFSSGVNDPTQSEMKSGGLFEITLVLLKNRNNDADSADNVTIIGCYRNSCQVKMFRRTLKNVGGGFPSLFFFPHFVLISHCASASVGPFFSALMKQLGVSRVMPGLTGGDIPHPGASSDLSNECVMSVTVHVCPSGGLGGGAWSCWGRQL